MGGAGRGACGPAARRAYTSGSRQAGTAPAGGEHVPPHSRQGPRLYRTTPSCHTVHTAATVVAAAVPRTQHSRPAGGGCVRASLVTPRPHAADDTQGGVGQIRQRVAEVPPVAAGAGGRPWVRRRPWRGNSTRPRRLTRERLDGRRAGRSGSKREGPLRQTAATDEARLFAADASGWRGDCCAVGAGGGGARRPWQTTTAPRSPCPASWSVDEDLLQFDAPSSGVVSICGTGVITGTIGPVRSKSIAGPHSQAPRTLRGDHRHRDRPVGGLSLVEPTSRPWRQLLPTRPSRPFYLPFLLLPPIAFFAAAPYSCAAGSVCFPAHLADSGSPSPSPPERGFTPAPPPSTALPSFAVLR